MLSAAATSSSFESLGFLSQLAHDDALRAELVANPVGVLAKFGVKMDPRYVPACVTLPSKEALSTRLNSLTGENDEDPLTEKIYFGFIAS